MVKGLTGVWVTRAWCHLVVTRGITGAAIQRVLCGTGAQGCLVTAEQLLCQGLVLHPASCWKQLCWKQKVPVAEAAVIRLSVCVRVFMLVVYVWGGGWEGDVHAWGSLAHNQVPQCWLMRAAANRYACCCSW
jgi:hypothetical protein